MGLNTSDMKQLNKLQHVITDQKTCLKRRLSSLSKPPQKPHKISRRKSSKKDGTIVSEPVNVFDKHGLAPMHYATQAGDVVKLQELISLGGQVNISTTESNGSTPPIVYAASNGHTDCVQLLLASGAGVNATDGWGNSAIFKASCYNYIDCVQALLQYGADPCIANKWGALPLQFATLQGYTKVVDLLLRNGAHSQPDHDGLYGDPSLPPPVVAAATKCHLDCLKILLDSDSQIHSSHLDSSLTMAMYYFLCACAGYQYTSTHASIQDRFECIKLLVSNGAPVSIEHLKMTCYHHFVPVMNLKAYIQMLKLILQAVRFDSSCKDWNNAMMVIFGHVTRLGRYKWQLIELICSVGFTPSQDLLEGLSFTFTDGEMQQLQDLRSTPRTLADMCRLTVRRHVNRNVHSAVQQLQLPAVIKSMVLVNTI